MWYSFSAANIASLHATVCIIAGQLWHMVGGQNQIWRTWMSSWALIRIIILYTFLSSLCNPYDVFRQACLSWGAMSGAGPLQVTSDVGHDEALVCPPSKTAGGGEAGRGSRQARMSDLVDSSTAEVKWAAKMQGRLQKYKVCSMTLRCGFLGSSHLCTCWNKLPNVTLHGKHLRSAMSAAGER